MAFPILLYAPALVKRQRLDICSDSVPDRMTILHRGQLATHPSSRDYQRHVILLARDWPVPDSVGKDRHLRRQLMQVAVGECGGNLAPTGSPASMRARSAGRKADLASVLAGFSAKDCGLSKTKDCKNSLNRESRGQRLIAVARRPAPENWGEEEKGAARALVLTNSSRNGTVGLRPRTEF